MVPDHYAVLDVPPDADARTVRAAYLAAMRASHPDRRPGDHAAVDRARAVNAAWEVLRDPDRRAAYDRTRGAALVRPLPRPATTVALREAAVAQRAYASTGARFRRAFHLAALRVGAAIVAVGLVLLLMTSGS
jgi:curved DNA-binding protein CbpA